MATSAIFRASLGLSFLLSSGQRGVLSETSSEASQKKLVRQPSAVNCTRRPANCLLSGTVLLLSFE